MTTMPRKTRARRHLALGLLLLVWTGAVPARAGNVWFEVSGAWNGLAMDDINDGTFRFHDTSIDGYDFPDIDGGFGLGFHLGSDIAPGLGFGFSWERQHAHVEGTDVDVTAKLKLDADVFMGHVYWRPLRGGKFSGGLAGGLGFLAANGVVDITDGGASYGNLDTSGSDLAGEAMFVAEYALAANKGLRLTAGWLLAKVARVDVGGRRATNEDGSDLALDYSGSTLRLGMIWRFRGGATARAAPVDVP